MVDYWLAQCYHSRHLATVMALFKARIEADQHLRKEASEKLSKLDNAKITGKCFISRKHVEYLREALR